MEDIYKDIYIDQLLPIRKSARENNDFSLSDEIRASLENRNVFIIDYKKNIQIVFFINPEKSKKHEISKIWIEKYFKEHNELFTTGISPNDIKNRPGFQDKDKNEIIDYILEKESLVLSLGGFIYLKEEIVGFWEKFF